MRRFASLLILLASACDNGHSPRRSPQNAARPAPSAPPAANTVNTVQAAPSDTPPPNDPGVSGLSPSQRRAYELGYRDCSHGRYAPDNHLEAYRIGCGAAHDRAGSSRPQG